MKNKLGIIFGGCIAVGLILMLISTFMLGGNMRNFGSNIQYEEKDYAASSKITSVYVKDSSDRVEVQTGDVKNVEVHYFENEDIKTYRIEEKDGMLSVERESKIGIFIFEISFVDPYVKVTVPKDYNGTLEVITSSGSIRCNDLNVEAFNVKNTSGGIHIENISTGDFNAENTSGEIHMTNVTADDMNVKNNSGEIDINDTTAKTLKAHNTSGGIGLENVTLESLEADNSSGGEYLDEVTADTVNVSASSGSIHLTNLKVGKEADLSANSGDIRGTIAGNESDFAIITNTTSGSSNLTNNASGEKKLNAETTSGSIHINFN